MEIHDYQSSVDVAMPHQPSAVPIEKMTPQAQGNAPVSPDPAVQAMPGQSPESKAQAAPVNPSAQTAIPDQQGQTVSQSPQAQTTGQQAQFQPNVIMDPGTGQLYHAMPQGQPVQPAPQNGQYAYHTVQAASVDSSVQTAIPDQQGQTVSQSPQAQTTGQQVQFQPNVIMDPGTGQLYYAMPQGQSVQPAPQNGQYVYHTVQAASVDPSAQTAIPDQQGQTVSQSPQAQTTGQQVQFQPNVIMDPGTGQLYYAMPQGQPVQPPPQNGQYAYYTAQTPPEQAHEPHQPDYAQIIKSVEDFAEGDASVADVVKTLWAETAQDDQFWKGAVVGAATAALLSSETMRGAMGKTFGSLFGKNAADAATPSSPAPDVNTDTK